MASLFEILILAVVQGATEWLPVSSSGHLVLVQQVLNSSGLGLPLFFNVLLHLATLFVVLIVFRTDIVEILRAVVHLNFESEEGRLALFIAVGSIPTAAVGLLFGDVIESFFDDLLVVGLAFVTTGCVLYVSQWGGNGRGLNFLDAVLIGVAQGTALVPGISRSGFTISTGLLRRVKRQRVFTYSFLLLIPATIGAFIKTGVSQWESLASDNIDAFGLVLGFVTAMIVGYIALKLLSKIVVRGKIHLFAYYCWTIGVVTIASYVFAVF